MTMRPRSRRYGTGLLFLGLVALRTQGFIPLFHSSSSGTDHPQVPELLIQLGTRPFPDPQAVPLTLRRVFNHSKAYLGTSLPPCPQDSRVQAHAVAAYHVYRPLCLANEGQRRCQDVSEQGFVAHLYHDPRCSQPILSFRGSSNLTDLQANLAYLIPDLLGLNIHLHPFQLLLRRRVAIALELAQRLQLLYPNLTVTGHSLGGLYAQIVAAHLGTDGVAFNAPGISSGFIVSLGPEIWKQVSMSSKANQNFINYRIPGDWVSAYAGHQHFGETFELTLPIDTPHPLAAHSMLTVLAAVGLSSDSF